MKSLVEEVLAENPFDASKQRARKGQWQEAGAAVKALVSTGFTVTESCRRVLAKLGLCQIDNLSSLRCAYYNHYARGKQQNK